MLEPNSTIHLLRNVPLDNTYKNTIKFYGLTDQYNYFMSKNKVTFEKYTYVRKTRSIRLGVSADSLFDCNYLVYQNANYGTKRFYCFITQIEYINDNTCDVIFDIDVMQTWAFDYTLLPSFVEREHVDDDTVGANIVVENVEIGDIICGDTIRQDGFDDYVAVICTAWDEDTTPGGVYGGLFSGVNYIAHSIESQSGVDSLLELLKLYTDARTIESVVSIFMFPSTMFVYGTSNPPDTIQREILKNDMIDGYTPKNKKLLTYPYNFLGVDCGNEQAVYRYEWFDTEQCNFVLRPVVTPNPEIGLYPLGYNGMGFNNIEKLTMKGFPQCAYSIDSYRAYLAQQATGDFVMLAGASMALGGSLATGLAPGVLASGVGVAATFNNIIVNSNKPPQAKGSSSANMDVATRSKSFYYKRMHISSQYCRILDDYFSVWGYQVNEIKTPNTSGRKNWNFVKTRNVSVTNKNGVPLFHIDRIKQCFDDGITFWANGSSVGNYSLDNSIV